MAQQQHQQHPLLPAYNDHYQYHIVTSPAAHVAHVQVNRPAKVNAFFEAMWLEFARLFDQLSADPDVRAVVLSGAGDRGFTSGLDLEAAAALLSPDGGPEKQQQPDPARKAMQLRRHVLQFQDSISRMEQCAKPVICVLHGISYGLAIDIACCADVRLCSADARLSVKEVDIGLAADIGTLGRLPKVAGGTTSWVKDVCLTARVFGAGEALAQGFVSRVLGSKAAALGAAFELAGVMAGKSPVAVQSTKEILNHARDHSVAENLRYTAVWNSAALQTTDIPRAMTAGIKKSKPRFEKL